MIDGQIEFDLSVQPDAVPESLVARDQWVLWGLEKRKDKWTKPPFQVTAPDTYAKSNDHTTWAGFEKAVTAAQKRDDRGLGFVITDEDPITMVDIDFKPDGPHSVPKWVPAVARLEGAYTEWSPSHAGLRILLHGVEEPEWWTDCRDEEGREIGVVETGKYATITGATYDA